MKLILLSACLTLVLTKAVPREEREKNVYQNDPYYGYKIKETFEDHAFLQYRFDKRKMSWLDAEKECAHWGGHLATIISAAQNKYIVNEMKKRHLKSAWIGYNDGLHEGTFQWLDSHLSSCYTNWRPTEPNGKRKENCAEVIPGKLHSLQWNGMWNDGPCSLKKSFVCEKPEAISDALLQYKFEKRKMSWLDAEKECLHWGGHLATIISAAQNEYIVHELKQRNLKSAWIGYNDRLHEGTFQWLDSHISSCYTNWRPTEPNGKNRENCAEIIPGKLYGHAWNGMWNDGHCSLKKSFVCEKPEASWSTDVAGWETNQKEFHHGINMKISTTYHLMKKRR